MGQDGETLFQRLAGASEIVVKSDKDGIPADAVGTVIAGAEIFIPLDELIDIE